MHRIQGNLAVVDVPPLDSIVMEFGVAVQVHDGYSGTYRVPPSLRSVVYWHRPNCVFTTQSIEIWKGFPYLS
jgi:hypothetical protein